MMNRQDKILNIEYAAIQAAHWAAFLIPVTFAANYLQAVGYTNTELGLILALGNVAGVIIGPFVASLIDRYERVTVLRTVPVTLTLQAIICMLEILTAKKGMVVSCCFIGNIGICALHNSLNTKLCVDLTHCGHEINFGSARAIGSLAFVVLSAIAGLLVQNNSVFILPRIQLGLICVKVILYTLIGRTIARSGGLAVHIGEAAENAESTSLLGFFRKYKRYVLMLLGVTLIFAGHNTTTNFMINITENVGGDTKEMGNLSAFMALMELPMMFLLSRAMRKFHISSLMKFSYIMFAVKGFAIAFAASVAGMYAAFLLQTVSFAIYTPGIVPYAEEIIPYEDSAKAQALGFTVTTAGSVLCTLVAGRLYDLMPVRSVLLIAAVTGLAGSVIAYAGVQKNRNSTANKYEK